MSVLRSEGRGVKMHQGSKKAFPDGTELTLYRKNTGRSRKQGHASKIRSSCAGQEVPLAGHYLTLPLEGEPFQTVLAQLLDGNFELVLR
jgi:hypothetical protein